MASEQKYYVASGHDAVYTSAEAACMGAIKEVLSSLEGQTTSVHSMNSGGCNFTVYRVFSDGSMDSLFRSQFGISSITESDCRAKVDIPGPNYPVNEPVGKLFCKGGCVVEVSNAVVETQEHGQLRQGYFSGAVCKPATVPSSPVRIDGGSGGGGGGGSGSAGDNSGGGGGSGGNNNGGGGGSGGNNNGGGGSGSGSGGGSGSGNGTGGGTGNNNGGNGSGSGNGGGTTVIIGGGGSGNNQDGNCDPKKQNCGSGFSGSCGNFQCTGDAIQCALSRELHEQYCRYNETTPEVEQFNQFANMGNADGRGSILGNLPNTTINFSSSSWDMSDKLGNRSCIGPKTYHFMGKQLTIDFSVICPYLEMIGKIFVFIMSLVCVKIVLGKK